MGALVTAPFTEFWKASEKLKQHFGKEGELGRETHRNAMQDALYFKSMMEGKSEPINVSLNKECSRRVEENRSKLCSIVKAVIFCGQQNIPLRGHRDDSKHIAESTQNTGNF